MLMSMNLFLEFTHMSEKEVLQILASSKVLMIAMKEFCSNRSSSVLEQAASSGV